MEQKICGFTDEPLVCLRDGRECDLDAFLTDLLRDPVRTVRPEARGIAAFGSVSDALGDHGLQSGQKREVSGAVATASPKHVSAPVWQVGPSGFAVISNVSLSQSGVTLTTFR